MLSRFQHLFANAAQVRAAQLDQRVSLERIELQIQLEAGHISGETFGKSSVFGDASAVGVHHQMLDGALLSHVEHSKEVRVQRRLAAGDLYYIGMALAAHHGV
jgi:hypothetical protein